jgi:hypothetical protein
MSETNPPSSWDDLIKQLGAEPPADALERRRPAIETEFKPPPAPPVGKPKPGDWNALASELGVELPPEEPTKLRPSAAARRAPFPEATPPMSPGAVEAGFAGIAPIESEFEDVVEEEIADVEFSEVDFEEDDSELEEDSDLSDEFAEADADEDQDERDALRPSSLSGEAARSAFEALFQAGSFSGGPRPEASAPRTREPAAADSTSRDRPDRDLRRPRRPSDHAEGAELTEGQLPEPESGERRRPRRRRRRGRGRGGDGRSEALQAPPESAARRDRGGAEAEGGEWEEVGAGPEPQDSDEADDEARSAVAPPRGDRPHRRRSRRGRGRGAAEGDESAPRNGRTTSPRMAEDREDADADAGEEADERGVLRGDSDEDDEGGEPRPAHKSIPSWAEAIGVMVETNMQSRKTSPQRPSRDRGRGRGGRGGRGRRRS